MRRVARYGAVACAAAAIAVAWWGCGGKKQIDEADARIQALAAKGVPDTLIAGPKVFLFQVRAAMKTGQSGIARRNRDSLMTSLERAEQWYEQTMQRLKPELEKMTADLGAQKKGLSGLQLRTADSMMAIVDSFTTINWLLQAKQKADLIAGMMPGLLNDEARMKELRPKIIGTWVGESEPEDKTMKAKERRKFIFGADGKLYIEEEMKGQTQEYLKEDWKFLSWGRWDQKGDTTLLYIEREKCERQTYWTLKEQAGRKQWVREDKPTYDTTITDGSKDRFMAWDYFQQFLKKVK